MSNISFRRPEFRLYLGYPDIVLTHAGRSLGTVGAEVTDLRAALTRLAQTVLRARGRLVAVLSEDEVWRGRLDLAGRDRAERRASARTIVAGRLGVSPDEVTVVLGARDASGSFPVAGVRRATLFETRALLAAVGLRPSAILGAGSFAGFPAAPRLGSPSWGLPWGLPSLPPHRQGLAAALGAGAMASLAMLSLGLPDQQAATPLVVVPASVATPVGAEAAVLPAPARAEVRPQVTPPPLGLRYAERPRPRPAALGTEPMVTVAARNLPDDLPLAAEAPRRGPVPKLLELAELTTARVRAIDATMPVPLRRPAAAPAPAPEVAEIARTAMPALPAPAATSDLRPMPRPKAEAPTAAAAPAAKPAPAPEEAALSPRPRAQPEGSQAAVLVASLDPAPLVAASLAAATASVMAAPPPARPAERPAAKPAPAVAQAAPAVARPKPVVAKPARAVAKAAPVVVRPKPVAVQPLVKQAAPQRQVLVRQAVATPARQKVVTAKPAPVRQKLVAKPKPMPVRQAARPAPAKPTVVAEKPVKAKPATHRVGLSRGNVSLVGVFAGAGGRHALVRLPNGNIERVKAGDRVQGVQVAAINADSVRLTGRRGKDTLLRLPD